MALKVKDVGTSASKWVSNAQSAATEYGANAAAAGQDWVQNTQAASQNFIQAVTAAGIQTRFSKGVARAGAEKYSRKITEVGASRYGTGVSAGQQDWADGFAPYAQTLAGLTLPARKPRGDPGNIQRVTAVSQALTAKRLSLLG